MTDDPAAFWAATAEFLTADPVLNSVVSTIVVKRATGEVVDAAPSTYVAVRDAAGPVVGVAVRTPPYVAVLTTMPAEAVALVAAAMADAGHDLPGVSGPADLARDFAELWCADGHRSYEVTMAVRLHVLGELTSPTGTPGRARPASVADQALLGTWSWAFRQESDPANGADEESTRGDVAQRIATGCAYVWLDDTGDGEEVVSYVGHSPLVAGVARVGPVYTPPERRGRGYASGLVADVTRRLLDQGACDVCLNTDLANPTSNKIYARLGYEPLTDTTAYAFHP
ncbi:MAG: GNAT family N-acetyltransferase [Streptosporangiales bacterium]|nr:GNAT family N-acetyltransferase [Streptosporangiales bacterium]